MLSTAIPPTPGILGERRRWPLAWFRSVLDEEGCGCPSMTCQAGPQGVHFTTQNPETHRTPGSPLPGFLTNGEATFSLYGVRDARCGGAVVRWCPMVLLAPVEHPSRRIPPPLGLVIGPHRVSKRCQFNWLGTAVLTWDYSSPEAHQCFSLQKMVWRYGGRDATAGRRHALPRGGPWSRLFAAPLVPLQNSACPPNCPRDKARTCSGTSAQNSRVHEGTDF